MGARPRFVYGGDADFAPYDYLDPDGRPTGFSVELVRALARDAGVDLEVRLGAWERVRADLDAGQIDLISLSHSEERLRLYTWLVQTWSMHQCVLFPPGRPAYPRSPSDLAGKTIAVQDGTAVAELLAGMEPPRPLLVPTATQSQALRLLEAGQVTGVGGNSLTLRLAASADGMYNLVEMPLREVPYGLMARKGRPDLEWVATSMARLRGTGTLETLAERFLAVPTPRHTWRDYSIYLWPLVGVVAAVSAGAVAWNRSLHRQVRSRTQELQWTLRQQEKAEEALRASEKKYRDIVDSSPVSIHRARPDGTLLMANPAFANLLGYASVEETLRLNMARDVWFDPAERDRFITLYQPVGHVADLEVRVKRKDGSPAWVQITAKVVKEPDGETVCFEVFARDINARKIAEAALRDSEARYRLLFEGNPMPMIAYDVESLRILAVNEAAVRMHGYSREELLDLSVSDLALPDDENLARFLATRFDPRPDVVHVGLRQQRRKDGSTVDVDLTSLAIGLGGRPARLILTRDVTEERRVMAERERLQEALRRSQTMSAMGALVAGVAHEVRNPLFSISANLDALESELGGPGGHSEPMRLLRSQVARLSRLMQDLLDYGKPPVLNRGATRPVDLVRRALRSCGPLAREHGVTLEQDVVPGLPDLEIDAGRMDQVFENLVANAIQHSPRGGRVRVAARLGPPPGASVAFSVENEGADLLSADIPRLFEPFFSQRKGGTGLGLPIAQRITETHGGRLSGASRPGGGAVFTVTLPVDGSKGPGAA